MRVGGNYFEVVMRKKYFQLQELEEIVRKDKAEIMRIAYLAGALYRIDHINLVDYCKLYDFICSHALFYENRDGMYITVAEAAKELGVTEHVVLQVFAQSNAVYKLAKHTLINLEEADSFIKQHRLDIEPMAVPEEKIERPRGSLFVREIMKSKGC